MAEVREQTPVTKPPVPTPAVAKRPPAPAAARQAVAKGKARAKGKRVASRTPRPSPIDQLTQYVRGFRFRLLPVTIFVAVLMLGVRVGDLWRLATHSATLPEIPATLAQNPPAQQPKPADKAAPEPPLPGKAATPAAAAKPDDKAAPAAPPAQTGPLGPIDDQELAKQLADRRAELDRRTKELEGREALLSAAEKRVDQKVQELEKMRAEIQNLLKSGDDKQNAQIDNLVGIYEKMKPKEAAAIFNEMALPQLLEIMPRMNPSKSSLVMAQMNPVKAKEVSTALLEHKNLPTIPQ
jgi:flagellar motility protein MotE (MotC chaperone)